MEGGSAEHLRPTLARNASQKTTAAANEARRIHIHGMGNIGMLVAHSLCGIPDPPPVTLLFYRPGQRDAFTQAGKQITLWRNGSAEAHGDYDTELVRVPQRAHGRLMSVKDAAKLKSLREDGMPSASLARYAEQAEQGYHKQLTSEGSRDPPIKHLILTVKASGAVASLLSVKHRLGPESTVLFLMNGLGFIEEVNEKVFPDPSTRPQYMTGITSHGVNHDPSKPFEPIHAGAGTISIGLAPKFISSAQSGGHSSSSNAGANPNTDLTMIASSRYLLQSLTRTPVLAAVAFSPTELLKMQLDKLAANAVINPLTALFDCPNGALLYNYPVTRAMRLLLVEISHVLTSLPEIRGQPNVMTRFSPERLETQVVNVANKTATNVSSMLQDVRAGKKTEIDYINGWVVKKGEELGITAGFNFMIVQMVDGKQQMANAAQNDQAVITEE